MTYILKRIYLAILVTGTGLSASAQKKTINYTDAKQLMIIGKATPTANIYQRLDSIQFADMPKAVKALSLNSAGIAFLFETNSPLIKAKWTLAKKAYYAIMTPIAHSGLDLYSWKNNHWQYVSVGKPGEGTAQDEIIINNMDTTMKQFMLYLPLYNTVTDLQIGITEGSVIRKPTSPQINTTKRVVVYGSSVVQGAAASRPGMAYPAIIQRKTGYDVINLGFSGSAKMEIALAKYLATVPADCYILDCIPNPSPEEIKDRAYLFIKYLHEHQKEKPIILVETIIRENGYWDTVVGNRIKKQNEEINKVYNQLLKEGIKNIYYIPAKDLVEDNHENTVDGIHLTDVGFTHISRAILPVLEKALNKK